MICASAQAVTVIDDSGQRVSLPHPARRIVSLAPHLTELAYAAGAGAYVVGVSSYSDYPLAAKQLTIVATYNSIDIEAINALQPDLILAWQGGNSARSLAKLAQLGIPIFSSHIKHIAGIADTLQQIGVLAQTQAVADHRAKQLMHEYQRLQQTYQRAQPVTAFLQIWATPLMTMNGKSLLSQALNICGASNIFADLPSATATINVESVLAANPQVIVALGRDDQWQQQWHQWSHLTAVRQHHLLQVNPDLLSRYGPRFLLGVEQLCQRLAAFNTMAA